jgi:hypothetical protein
MYTCTTWTHYILSVFCSDYQTVDKVQKYFNPTYKYHHEKPLELKLNANHLNAMKYSSDFMCLSDKAKVHKWLCCVLIW